MMDRDEAKRLMQAQQLDQKGPDAIAAARAELDLARKMCEDRGKSPDTVYAHVERTVHALLDVIIKNSPTVDDRDAPGLSADGIKMLAEAVQALSSWPQFNPMNAHEQYQKLAEYEVERAFKAKREALTDVADELEQRLHAAVQR